MSGAATTRTERVPVEGAALHVEIDVDGLDRGSGPGDGQGQGNHSRPTTLFTVNGAFCTVRVWDNVVGLLQPGLRVVRHDVRGTGRSSPGPADDYRFERYADDLIALADHLSVDTMLVWGMAWGARVALVTAARHPERVARLVLSDFAIDPADPDAQRAGARGAAAAREAAGITEAPKPEGWNHHDDPDEATKAMAATRLHPDLMPFVSQVRGPTLIATGDHDPNLISSRRALPAFANGRLVVVPHAGHGLVRQRPDTIAAIVKPFLLRSSSGVEHG